MQKFGERIEAANYHEAVELFFRERWSDGLAVVPPTPDKVEAMLRAGGRKPDEELGEVPPRYGVATVEKLAINAVMAGCLPEYFPVVLAAVEAMLDPHHYLNGTQTTTHGNEPLVIVHGPIAKQLGVNAGESLFGRGYRANGTIGRAIRLILWNLGGNYPGEPDKSTFSHPGSWSYCIAEAEDESPWPPFHVDRGLPAGSNAVTVFSCEAPHTFIAGGSAHQTLSVVAQSMATTGSNNFWFMGECLLVMSPLIVEQLHKEGWTKQDVKYYVWQKARVPLRIARKGGPHTAPETMEAFKKGNWLWPKWIDQANDDELIPLTKRPEDIHVLVAGGRYMFNAFCPGWGDFGGFAVTKEIKRR